MTNNATIESLDNFTEIVGGFLAELRAWRKKILLVDQATAKLGSLNEEIGRKQEQLAELDNKIKQILDKLHLRKEAA